MASTLPSTIYSNNTYYSNETLIPPQEIITQSNNKNHTHYSLAMWLGQEDYFLPFSNSFENFDNLFVSDNTNNHNIDRSSNSNSIADVPSFGLIGLDYYNSSSCFTYDDQFETNNVCSKMQNHVLCTNNFVASPHECRGHEGHTSQVQVCGSEQSSESSISIINKVGRYSVEERKHRIRRYLNKRNQRNFRKTIKYACRKTLADRRVRIRGRFAKNQEHEQEQQEEDQSYTNFDNPTTQEDTHLLPFDNAFNKACMQHEDIECGEEWVEEAMSSLLYMPYISSNWECHA
ncbi:zinc finger protein CONSTANS-LIKE 5 [Amaranthus tricolor]|uniref:zinc finger protein CONSTANS-LIKE 5 n=1 Tax=Amaranthus tricolor TaxID=29722 RepID=UPI00258305C8|nr:zinc finger protein CONSTANS-LIKE 5 [Amaranthus tricolor]